MKSLEHILCCEQYNPAEYGGSAQGKGFYIVADHKNGFGQGGELDIKIAGNKITIKENKKPSRSDQGHYVFLVFEKAGKYNLDIAAGCGNLNLRIGGVCKASLVLSTSGSPIQSLFIDNKKLETIDLKGADFGYMDFDGLTALKSIIGPTSKECGFRIAKCTNLTSVDFSNILTTPRGTSGRLYVRNCKKLATLMLPQAIGMDLHLEKLPALSQALKQLAKELCEKSGVKYIDLDK